MKTQSDVLKKIKVGTRVHNHGDVCNNPHIGTVYAVEMPPANTVAVPVQFWVEFTTDNGDGPDTECYSVFWTAFTGPNPRMSVYTPNGY
jgi:hypothetical protein